MCRLELHKKRRKRHHKHRQQHDHHHHLVYCCSLSRKNSHRIESIVIVSHHTHHCMFIQEEVSGKEGEDLITIFLMSCLHTLIALQSLIVVLLFQFQQLHHHLFHSHRHYYIISSTVSRKGSCKSMEMHQEKKSCNFSYKKSLHHLCVSCTHFLSHTISNTIENFYLLSP